MFSFLVVLVYVMPSLRVWGWSTKEGVIVANKRWLIRVHFSLSLSFGVIIVVFILCVSFGYLWITCS